MKGGGRGIASRPILTMKLYDLSAIGQACKRIRLRKCVKQIYVATASGMSPSTVVQFEKGCNNNMLLLVWYMENLASWEDIKNEMERSRIADKHTV